MKEAQRAIQKEIKQRESQIKQHQTDIRNLNVEVKELQKALSLVGGKSLRASRGKRSGPSVPDAVEKVLKQAGKPLHVKEIAEKIGVEAARVSAGLQRFIKEGKRFKKTARATFGLVGARKKQPSKKPRKASKPKKTIKR